MSTAQKAIEMFKDGNDFDNISSALEAERFGSSGLEKFAVFSDGSAIKGDDYRIDECDADEAMAAIDQQ